MTSTDVTFPTAWHGSCFYTSGVEVNPGAGPWWLPRRPLKRELFPRQAKAQQNSGRLTRLAIPAGNRRAWRPGRQDRPAQHRAGVEKAKQLYATPVVKDCDIVVTNAFPIENQAIKAVWPGRLSLKEGGLAVVILQSVEGQMLHYLSGRFGTNYGGKLWGPPKGLLIPQADRVLICSSYQSRNDLDVLGPPDKVVPCETWGEVMIHLLNAYPDKAKVAVYPYAAIQCPVED